MLATVSRLDGAFGLYDLNGKSDPLSGGLAGLSKTARHEWPEVHRKAIDIVTKHLLLRQGLTSRSSLKALPGLPQALSSRLLDVRDAPHNGYPCRVAP